MKSPSGGISRIELAIFCRQFSAMLSAGVDAFRGIEVLRQQTDNPRLVEILDGIARLVIRQSLPTLSPATRTISPRSSSAW